MTRMIDLVRGSAVPANLMQAAARGALSVPPTEMIEILVYLAKHNKIFGPTARLTLAGWDEKSSLAAAADPAASPEVLDYLISPENLRPRLLPALLANPSVSQETLISLAASGNREVVNAMLESPRVQAALPVLNALTQNPHVNAEQTAQLHSRLQAAGFESFTDPNSVSEETTTPVSPEATAAEEEADRALADFLVEHAKEIAGQEEKPFQPLGGLHEELEAARAGDSVPEAQVAETAGPEVKVQAQSSGPASAGGAAAGTARAAAKPKKTYLSHEEERGSALQKISRLDVKGRIQLAMKGTKEERSILVRDGTKLVAVAVLDSPKLTDGEVEQFASQKNVLEALLRAIPMKRRFLKNYAVIRNLVFNPRTPLDVSLGLMKNLLIGDLRNLASNKEVPETIRKLALKMFKQKSDPSKKSSA